MTVNRFSTTVIYKKVLKCSYAALNKVKLGNFGQQVNWDNDIIAITCHLL